MSRRVYERKTIPLLPHQQIANGTVKIGEEFNLDGAHELWLAISHAMVEAGTNTNAPIISLQGSHAANPAPSDWFSLFPWVPFNGGVESEALSNSEAIGATLIEVASTTNLLVRGLIYIQNTTVDLGEWHQIKAVTLDQDITLMEGLANAQDGTLFTSAERLITPLNVKGIQKLRMFVDHLGATALDSEIKVDGVVVTSLIG